ncbi:helix-turn-helix domain-containing protein [Streptomyces bambusae]|uniref:helix-turn-helix domain-containing protein n=1 Tax=Streptomyces bambusae TaxID=1550616 RepID=UPI001CFEDD0A|nr:helix-turn-helix transcriptional regulator [Streptomyces bambusae]MCB5168508.1 helix-turn-helix domain-containing protein [Streptomyces bambusae]
MSMDPNRNDDSTDEPGWEVDPEDEQGAAVVAAVGRQLKAWREGAGLRAADFAKAIGYGEDLVYKVEAGKRIPRPEYLDRADGVLNAGGKIRAMQEDVGQVRYPKQVRNLAKLESQAVELLAYGNHNIHGLLQTETYARALLETWRPAYGESEIERLLAARMARQTIFNRAPLPTLSFVLEEAILRRPIGGKMVLRRQLEHILEVARLRGVDVQVMLTNTEDHAGMGGLIQVLKFGDGSGVGRTDGRFGGRPVSDPRQLRVLELRYGIIRAQALPPRESLAFIEQVLGET